VPRYIWCIPATRRGPSSCGAWTIWSIRAGGADARTGPGATGIPVGTGSGLPGPPLVGAGHGYPAFWLVDTEIALRGGHGIGIARSEEAGQEKGFEDVT